MRIELSNLYHEFGQAGPSAPHWRLGRPDYHEPRRGDSDPALEGKARRTRAMDLSDNLVVQLDIVTEAVNRSWHERDTRRSDTDCQRWVRHPVKRWMAAILDGFENELSGLRLFPCLGVAEAHTRAPAVLSNKDYARRLQCGAQLFDRRNPRVSTSFEPIYGVRADVGGAGKISCPPLKRGSSHSTLSRRHVRELSPEPLDSKWLLY